MSAPEPDDWAEAHEDWRPVGGEWVGDTRPTARLRGLAEGWNSYGARTPDPETLDVADRLVAALGALGLRVSVCPTAQGGASLEADCGPVGFELCVEPGGRISLLVTDGDGCVLEAEGAAVEGSR